MDKRNNSRYLIRQKYLIIFNKAVIAGTKQTGRLHELHNKAVK